MSPELQQDRALALVGRHLNPWLQRSKTHVIRRADLKQLDESEIDALELTDPESHFWLMLTTMYIVITNIDTGTRAWDWMELRKQGLPLPGEFKYLIG